jgi:hypothetical protein
MIVVREEKASKRRLYRSHRCKLEGTSREQHITRFALHFGYSLRKTIGREVVIFW